MNYTLEELKEMMDEEGSLDLSGTQITNPKHYKKLKNGDYVAGKYLYCDNMLVHIKRKKKIGEYTYFTGKIKGVNVLYDGKNYAHCESFKDGVKDIEFKKAKERGADQYKKYNKQSVVTAEEAKTMYRVITGACQIGTENFIKSLRVVKKELHSARAD